MRVSVNPSCFFRGLPLKEALARIEGFGFSLFELWRIGQAQFDELSACLRPGGPRLAAFCPQSFTLNDEALHEGYLASLREAVLQAKALNAPALITQVGEDTGAPRAQQRAAIKNGLRRAAALLEPEGLTLLIEPLNSKKDHPGTFLTDSLEGFDLVREADSSAIRLLFDVYHQLHMGEDALARIRGHLDCIGHFHLAGFPARDDRLFEGYDHRALLEFLASSGTRAPVGLELFPRGEKEGEVLLRELAAYL
ncbi:MAG: sugar phosphate isomerase/epimerase [Christensenellaceae bacterium]|jgi:hydroxypyruvate isomerase|nr:sugar phosphate isomerase/epimerase [Christensenellaceae bacterium]